MGSCSSTAATDKGNATHNGSKLDRSRSRAVQSQLQKDRRRVMKERHVLVCGDDRVGKSTLIKRLFFLSGGTLSTEDRRTYAARMQQAAMAELCSVLSASQSQPRVPSKSSRSLPDCDSLCLDTFAPLRLALSSLHPNDTVTPLLAAHIAAVCKDPRVRHLLTRACKDPSSSSAYLLTHIDRICSAAYSPSDEDIVRCTETTLVVPPPFRTGEDWVRVHELCLRMPRVGGPGAIPLKWARSLGGFDAIVLVASLSTDELKAAKSPRKPGDASCTAVDRLLRQVHAIQAVPSLSRAPLLLVLNRNAPSEGTDSLGLSSREMDACWAHISRQLERAAGHATVRVMDCKRDLDPPHLLAAAVRSQTTSKHQHQTDTSRRNE